MRVDDGPAKVNRRLSGRFVVEAAPNGVNGEK